MHSRKSRLCCIGLMLGIAMACGSIVTVAWQGPASPVAPQATAVLRGIILFEGTPPPPQVVQMAADPYCAQFTKTRDDIRVSNRGLENVMVYVSSAVSAPSSQIPADRILDQRQCWFEPRVLTMQVGQKLIILNSDQTAHNVHAWSTVNRPFNIAMATSGARFEHVFDQPEAPFPIRDDIHNWKAAFAGVFAHPFHTVSRTDGVFELQLPVGTHQITAWHERLGVIAQSVRIDGGGDQRLDFVFKQR